MTWSDSSKSCCDRTRGVCGRVCAIPASARIIVLLLLLVTGPASTCLAQNTTAGGEGQHSPRGALWRAAAAPGWGQIYNRQYLKLPILYGALGGLVYTFINLNEDYQLYRRAFQYKAFQEQVDSGQIELNPKAEFKSSYDKLSSEFGPISSRPLEARRDNFRRNRDLTALGVGIVYGLSILDAFVSAHLMDFDVSDNLAFEITPSRDGVSLTVQIPVGR